MISARQNPAIEQGLERATIFLSLVSLIALIVGALGVATAIQAHFAQKMDSIAVMKCLGARSNQIVWIYVLQTAGTRARGRCAGRDRRAGGAARVSVFPGALLQRQRECAVGFCDRRAGNGHRASLRHLLFTLPPLLSIKRIRPGLIFRREMAEDTRFRRPAWKRWLRNARESIIAALLILVGHWRHRRMAQRFRPHGHLLCARLLRGSLLFLTAVAWALFAAFAGSAALADARFGPASATASRIFTGPAITRNPRWWRWASA